MEWHNITFLKPEKFGGLQQSDLDLFDNDSFLSAVVLHSYDKPFGFMALFPSL